MLVLSAKNKVLEIRSALKFLNRLNLKQIEINGTKEIT
jgi:hypothetical protein